MKTNRINRIIALLVTTLVIGCTDKIVDLVIRINETFEYITDDKGEFSETYLVTSGEVLANFDYEVSEVSDVNISYLQLEVTERPTNQASRVIISGFYQQDENVPPTPVFENFEFRIADFTSGPVVITGYQAAGINAIASHLRDYINNTDLGSFMVSLSGTALDASGNASDLDLHLALEITLDAEVVFKEEVTLPDL